MSSYESGPGVSAVSSVKTGSDEAPENSGITTLRSFEGPDPGVPAMERSG